MANFTEKTKIDPRRFVPVTSRYVDSVVVYYTENKLITFQLYKKKEIPNSKKDKYAVVTAGTQYRPDKISQQAYGTPDFWWKILEANGLKDVYDLKAGLNIRIPDALFR